MTQRTRLVEAIPDAERIADEFAASGRSPGLAYGVVLDGALVHSGGRGEAVLGGPAPDAGTVFRIASMTKSFVAATIVALRDDGLIALDDPVGWYVPELEGVRGPTRDSRLPTVRDLLTMSAGWATDDPWADREESMSESAYSSMLSEGFTFDETPGVGFDYSNLSYSVLGRIITEVTGTAFQDAVATRVLSPLGLTSTAFRHEDLVDVDLADGHVRRDDAWQVEPASPTGAWASIGGLHSNVEDLARWVGVLCGAFPARDDDDPGVPLVRASLREMQQAHRFITVERGVPGDLERPGEAMSYGFGLVVSTDPRFGVIVAHSGGYPGFGSRMVWHPQSGVGVIGLANGRYGGPYRDTQRMLLALLDRVDAPARLVRPTAAAWSAYDRVDALLDAWDDDAVDQLVSSNVDGDIPRDRRSAEIAAAIAAVGGLVGPREDVVARTPSHLTWWRPGAAGRVRVEVLLTPQAPQRVQTLGVRAVCDPAPETRAAVAELVNSLWSVGQWPVGIAHAPDLDVHAVVRDVWRAKAAGVPAVLESRPVMAPSGHDVTYELRGPDMHAHVNVVLDPRSGVVTCCAVHVLGDEWPTAVHMAER